MADKVKQTLWFLCALSVCFGRVLETDDNSQSAADSVEESFSNETGNLDIGNYELTSTLESDLSVPDEDEIIICSFREELRDIELSLTDKGPMLTRSRPENCFSNLTNIRLEIKRSDEEVIAMFTLCGNDTQLAFCEDHSLELGCGIFKFYFISSTSGETYEQEIIPPVGDQIAYVNIQSGVDWIFIQFHIPDCHRNLSITHYSWTIFQQDEPDHSWTVLAKLLPNENSVKFNITNHVIQSRISTDNTFQIEPCAPYGIKISPVYHGTVYGHLSTTVEAVTKSRIIDINLRVTNSLDMTRWNLAWDDLNCTRHLAAWDVNIFLTESALDEDVAKPIRIPLECSQTQAESGAKNTITINRRSLICSDLSENHHGLFIEPCENYTISISPVDQSGVQMATFSLKYNWFYEAPGAPQDLSAYEEDGKLAIVWNEPSENLLCLEEYHLIISANKKPHIEVVPGDSSSYNYSVECPSVPCSCHIITVESIGRDYPPIQEDNKWQSALYDFVSANSGFNLSVEAVEDSCLDISLSLENLECTSHVSLAYRIQGKGEWTKVNAFDDNDVRLTRTVNVCHLSPDTNYEVKASLSDSDALTSVQEVTTLPVTQDSTAAVLIVVMIVLIILVVAIGIYMGKASICHERLRPFNEPKSNRMSQRISMNLMRRKSHPIKISDVPVVVQRLCSQAAKELEIEFEDLTHLSESHVHSKSEASKMENKSKNRYCNVLPFDHSRVVLDNQQSDYINASYVPGFNGPKEYIASQGPKASTVSDWWRMIWEQNVQLIIMVTALEERGKSKCFKYWPDSQDGEMKYDSLQVHLQNEKVYEIYTMRHLQLTRDDSVRTVKQMYFNNWPDFGCPENPESLVSFIEVVRRQVSVQPNAGPMVVHCSAGVGRTGTFIAVDWLMQEARVSKQIDVFSTVLRMRECRMNMVQTEDQYQFVYECLSHYVTSRLISQNGVETSLTETANLLCSS